MKAAIRHTYGSPDVIRIAETDKPVAGDDDVLVEVRATSLNASDWEFLTGRPRYVRTWGLLKPKFEILGSDIAGRVEAVGKNVSQFQPGDEVYGDILGRWGGLAEYVCAPADALTRKPAAMSFEQAAAVPQAGLVALQGLRDKGELQSGQKVLINGAGGGSGTFAIQVAKVLGAKITGVDSARKFDTMRALGADHVIDFAREDYTSGGKRYDLILDFVASHPLSANKRALRPGGSYVLVGGSLPRILAAALLGPVHSLTGKKMGMLLAKANEPRDMATMAEFIEAGTVVPIIDKTYPLSEAAEALRYLGEGQARGKVIVTP